MTRNDAVQESPSTPPPQFNWSRIETCLTLHMNAVMAGDLLEILDDFEELHDHEHILREQLRMLLKGGAMRSLTPHPGFNWSRIVTSPWRPNGPPPEMSLTLSVNLTIGRDLLEILDGFGDLNNHEYALREQLRTLMNGGMVRRPERVVRTRRAYQPTS